MVRNGSQYSFRYETINEGNCKIENEDSTQVTKKALGYKSFILPITVYLKNNNCPSIQPEIWNGLTY